MGLFSSLLDDITEGVSTVWEAGTAPGYRAAIQPWLSPAYKATLKPVLQRAVLPALDEYNRRVSGPYAAAVKAAIDHPELLSPLLSPERRRQLLGKEGFSRANFFTAAMGGDRQAQEEAQRSLAPLPLWQRIPLGIISDPMTYAFLGTGGAAGFGKAVAEGGLEAALRASTAEVAREGLRPAAWMVARELAAQTGLPQIARVPYSMTVGAVKAGRLGRLKMLDVATELMADDVRAGKIGALNEVERMATLSDLDALRAGIQAEVKGTTTAEGIAARLKLNFKFPDLKTLESKYGKYADTLARANGSTLDAVDYYGRMRKSGGVTMLASSLVSAADEGWKARYAHQIEEAGALERGVQRIPGVKQVWNALSPVTRARIEQETPYAIAVKTRTTLETAAQDTHTMVGDLAYREAKAGLVPDPMTGIVRGVKPLGDLEPSIENIVHNPAQFALTAAQRDVVDGANLFQRARRLMAIQELEGLSSLNKDQKAFLEALKSGNDDYFRRMPLYVSEEPGNAAAQWAAGELRPSFWRTLAAKIHVPSPLGDIRLPVQRIGGEAIPSGFRPYQQTVPLFGKQSIEYAKGLQPGEEAARMIRSYRISDSIGDWSRQLDAILTRELVTKPGLKALGYDLSAFVRGEHDIAIADLVRQTDRVGKLQNTLQSVLTNRGASPATARAIRSFASHEDIPEDVRATLESYATEVDNYVTGLEATRMAGGRISRKLGKVGGKLEAAGEARARAPFEPPGGTLPRQTFKQAEPTILKGQQAQELAAQMTGEGVAAEVVGPRTGLTRAQLTDEARALKTVEQVTPVTSERLVAVREDLADIIAGKGKVPKQGIVADAEEARKSLVRGAKAAHQQVDAKLAGLREDLKTARAERVDAIKAGTAFDFRKSRIPQIAQYFPTKVAADVDKYFAPQEAGGVTRRAAVMQAIPQSLMAGGDVSVTLMQSFAAAPANPVGWAKAFSLAVGSTVNPGIYWRYLEGLSKTADLKSGMTVLEQATRAKLSLSGTELFAPAEAMAAMGASGAKTTAVAEWVARMPLNRAFSIQRNVASLELFRSQVNLEQALAGRALRDDELEAVGRQVNLATGAVSSQRLGIQPGQATVERTMGRFGVQWFRSQTGRLVQAFQAGTLDGQVARRLLTQQIAAMTVLYMAAAKATGQAPDLDPTSRDFLTIKVGGSRVRWGGIFPSVMRTVSQTAEAVATGDVDRLTDIKNGRNPILNFWRNGAPVMGGLIADMVGVNANTPYGGLSHVIEHPEQYIEPFAVQSALDPNLQGGLLERVIAGASSGLGLAQSPQTPTDIWKGVTDQYAKDRGVADWVSLPKAEQTRALRDVPELAQAEADRQSWFDRGNQTPLDVAFDQTGKSRAAMGDVLSGLWARVQSGQMTRAEWRQVYNDWSGRHAYFSENVFGSLPAEDQAKLNKDAPLLQDRLASRFAAIQPQDTTGTGTPSEEDWKAWRTARDQFWKDNPEALPFRSYIMFDYPTSRWDNPIMGAADQERRMASDQYDEYLSLPKYRGMSVDEADFLDALVGAKNRAAKELTAMVVQQGADPNRVRIPAKIAWQYAVASLQQAGVSFDARRAELLKLAAVIDAKPRAKLQLIDPRRFAFLRSNPALMDWYPGAVTATGIPQDILVHLGLIQEMPGQSLAERGASMLQ